MTRPTCKIKQNMCFHRGHPVRVEIIKNQKNIGVHKSGHKSHSTSTWAASSKVQLSSWTKQQQIKTGPPVSLLPPHPLPPPQCCRSQRVNSRFLIINFLTIWFNSSCVFISFAANEAASCVQKHHSAGLHSFNPNDRIFYFEKSLQSKRVFFKGGGQHWHNPDFLQ